jgi:Flp pilus assembly protein TadD
LGNIEKFNEVLKAAIKVYSRYLYQHPDDSRAHMLYALDLLLIGNNEEAKVEAAKAVELNPTDPLMQYNASCFYSRLGEKQLAIETLKNAMTAGYQDYEWIKRDSDLDNIRNEQKFLDLMRGK